jgi:hypothetical protein
MENVFAEFGLAKCLLAAPPSPTSLREATEILERLSAHHVADLNFRIEIDHALAFALGHSGERRRLREFLWQCWRSYALREEGRTRLDDHGKFWLDAIGRELIRSLDPAIDAGAIHSIGEILDALQGKPN